MYESIECFYNFGKLTLHDYHKLFLKQARIVKEKSEINKSMAHKITFFLTLFLDFSAKISLFLKSNRNDNFNSERIYASCYENIVK